MEIVGQEILTKDKAQLRINFSVQYKVTDATKALLENKEFDKQMYVIIQLSLREFIGKMTFDELMENKEKISESIMTIAAAKVRLLGIELLNCGVKDIVLPGDIRDIMNQVLVAEKRAQANLITRREETASTRSLLNTAKLMEENAMLYKLKEMEYVEKIAEKINNISLSGSGQIVDQLKQIFVK
ncbi:FtsH protease regulator HflK [compost metagenome]